MSVKARRLLKSVGGALLIMILGLFWPLSVLAYFLPLLLEPLTTKLANSGGDWFLTEFLPFVGVTGLNFAAWVGILYVILGREEKRRQHEEAVRGGVA